MRYLNLDWIRLNDLLYSSSSNGAVPTVKDNVNFELLSTPQCRVRNSSYEFAVFSKNKIQRDFWETQSLKNGINRRFWKKIASLWLRHLRFESLLRVYNANKPVTSFCQVFKVEICEANTTVTWQVDIICHHRTLKMIQFLVSCFISWAKIKSSVQPGNRNNWSRKNWLGYIYLIK